jgi:hypothetical protein
VPCETDRDVAPRPTRWRAQGRHPRHAIGGVGAFDNLVDCHSLDTPAPQFGGERQTGDRPSPRREVGGIDRQLYGI